jgi:DNA mismatch repair protein MutS2
VGGVLEPGVLLEVADTVAAGRRLRQFIVQRSESVPQLSELAHRIGEFGQIEQAVNEAINDHAEIRDDASPALARLRKEQRTLRNRMLERMNSIIRSPAYRDMLQDPVVTTRDGRYCVPVKSESRSQFGGLVHDQSSSGATVFMEPAAVVEMGNELRQVDLRERAEVERILRELTALVGRHAEDLTYTLEALGELDFIFARGKVAGLMNASEPVINKEGFIGLRRARHPLLAGPVVPIDLELGRAFRVLVITGPNTGGKTVGMKTAGLLCLMAQSGLHIPADSGSTLPVFHGIYADIGDEQSIQQSLSTFSGHITNIAGILKAVEKSGRRSLVLLDEAGAGTDPTEGAALAKAILMELLQRDARVISSTHYGELKEFAYSTEGVENASVEFDTETLRPTYRLLIGVPGASNAFSIAARLGLPGPVVESARSMIGTDRAVLSDVIQRLTQDQRSTEVDARRASEAARDVEAKREQYDRELKRLREERVETLAKARQEAEEIVRTARREMDRVKDELKRLERQARRASEENNADRLQELRDRMQKVSGRAEHRAERVEKKVTRVQPTPAPERPEPVRTDTTPPAVGDLVWVPALAQRGTVLSLEDGKAQVQIGPMRMGLALDSIQRILTPSANVTRTSPGSQPGREADIRMKARAHISPEVQLLGLRADEALSRLDDYVDEACLAGLSPVRVVHGKGTGALRKVVWEFLRGHPHVSSFRHPPDEEGGSGVTVVELRE